MIKRYYLKYWLILVLILNLTVLFTQYNSTKVPSLVQAIFLVLNSSLSLLICWIILAETKLKTPESWPVYYKFPLSIILAVISLFVFDYLIEILVPKSLLTPAQQPGFQNRLLGCLLVSFICYVVYHVVFTSEMLQRSRLEIEQLKQVNLRAQVIGLQQQLSPHFLFNSLSTLKGLTPDETSKEFIMHLSTIYRYLIVSGERQIVTLSEELDFVKAYIFIQQKRFGAALQIQMDIPNQYLTVQLPPLSVQLLIENAIKHNAFSHDSPLSVIVNIDADQNLAVMNDRREKTKTPESLGLGLQNIRERYKLLLNKEIIVRSQPESFTVCLPLTSYANNHN